MKIQHAKQMDKLFDHVDHNTTFPQTMSDNHFTKTTILQWDQSPTVSTLLTNIVILADNRGQPPHLNGKECHDMTHSPPEKILDCKQ